MITSPRLSAEDIEAIKYGYDRKADILEAASINSISKEIEDLDDKRLQLLAELIKIGCLDIRIAITKDVGMYHDKLGIIEDSLGNKIAFYGSANESLYAYKSNYEKVRISRNWIEGEKETVEDELKEFDTIWNGENKFVETYNFQESIDRRILEICEKRKTEGKKNAIDLRDYQKEAIYSWVSKGYKGFYVMATGTGKTWTAIYSAKELVKQHSATVVICAPYKHLVKQWAEDLERAFPKATLILVSSENAKWEEELSECTVRERHYSDAQTIIISTIKSFNGARFRRAISKSNKDKLLIVDEAHRFTRREISIYEEYKYLLGLSATPMSGKDNVQGAELVKFFGGLAYNLPIEIALEKKFLVKYNYFPIFIHATEEEERKFRVLSKNISACFKNNVLTDRDSLVQLSRARLRLIAMAEEKTTKIDNIIDEIKTKDHFVVYCGDGRLFNENRQEESRHIQFVKDVLTNHGYKASQFTASENMAKRMELVEQFNNGEISALAAIRCLDEGINIPSIRSALILASNDNYREFVQRRGRILRHFKDKEIANIFDVIVLPSTQTPGMAAIELRRFYEYAHLANNKEERLLQLEDILGEYSMKIENVNTFITDIEEDELDE